MNITIDFGTDISARLTELARSRGIEPADLVKDLVADSLSTTPSVSHSVPAKDHFYFTASADEFQSALDEIARMNQDVPGLPDSAFDRGSLYEDRL